MLGPENARDRLLVFWSRIRVTRSSRQTERAQPPRQGNAAAERQRERERGRRTHRNTGSERRFTVLWSSRRATLLAEEPAGHQRARDGAHCTQARTGTGGRDCHGTRHCTARGRRYGARNRTMTRSEERTEGTRRAASRFFCVGSSAVARALGFYEAHCEHATQRGGVRRMSRC